MGFRRVHPAGAPAAPSPAVQAPAQPVANDDPPQQEVETSPAEAMDEAAADGGYQVGRGKPPLHTRWKKGQSGNPAGKKSGTRNNATIALEIFGEILTVQTPSGPRRMNTIALAYYKLREMVAKGDLKAIATVIAIWQRIVPDPSPDIDMAEPALSPSEEALLEGLLAQLGEAPKIKGRTNPGIDAGKGGVA